MQCTIYAALKADGMARMVQVEELILADLAKGNVHKLFCHLKGWYQAVTETQARPCFQTIEKQTAEHVDLYQQHESPGPPVAVNIATMDVRDDAPTNGEIRAAVSELTNGRSVGASHMRAEHLKEWLRGMKLEEDPKTAPNNVGTGDRWRTLAGLSKPSRTKVGYPSNLGG
jgi:hypothetical protein